MGIIGRKLYEWGKYPINSEDEYWYDRVKVVQIDDFPGANIELHESYGELSNYHSRGYTVIQRSDEKPAEFKKYYENDDVKEELCHTSDVIELSVADIGDFCRESWIGAKLASADIARNFEVYLWRKKDEEDKAKYEQDDPDDQTERKRGNRL